ncbi:fatty acid-binding protein DegV [Anaerobacillus arseniciselenatis]|uniref:Fatty acid-binding protein DegV n=1 Tax=Anaerobacillus arseniciselenatis TaxID=85682 RepID=A0A1S2LY09_9BACI|nr:DegV family protein [Anaerobacillus arseniciselenatis]OIJ16285.1 fatty acid-binding protein DegV [Anaerobacillus arseniciselenatis]
MSKVKIVTDSTVDVPKEELDALGVEVVPLTITIDGKSYVDGVDVSAKEYITLLKEAKDIPRTSQPAAGVFAEIYDRLGADGSEIISIHISNGMSGTFNSAQSGAEISKSKVTVVDSKFISFALGFQVVEAAKMAKEGKTVEEIISRINQVRENSSLYLMVDTLEYLLKGGRIGRGKALVGSLLKIKPIASLADGVYTPVSKVRTYPQLIKYFIKQLQDETANKTIKSVGIAHADTLELATKIKEAIIAETQFNDIRIVDTTPIISTHTGPGAIALMYFAE